MLIDWPSIEVHQEFAEQDFYPALISGAVSACASDEAPPVVYNAALSPASPPVLRNETGKGKSAVAELVHQYFSATKTPAVIEKEAQRFLSELAGAAEGLSGQTALGCAVEELEQKGEKSRVLVIAVGWERVAANPRFRDTEDFETLVPMLEGLPG